MLLTLGLLQAEIIFLPLLHTTEEKNQKQFSKRNLLEREKYRADPMAFCDGDGKVSALIDVFCTVSVCYCTSSNCTWCLNTPHNID